MKNEEIAERLRELAAEINRLALVIENNKHQGHHGTEDGDEGGSPTPPPPPPPGG